MDGLQGSRGRALVLAAALLAAPGCARWGDAWGAPRPNSVRTAVIDGQVWSMDRRRGLLQLRGDRGRTHTVLVDDGTRVTYLRRSYPLDVLERGDVVRIWVDVDRRGDAWADRVDVRSSARDRGRYDRYGYDDRYGSGRIERLEGRVVEVNLRQRFFTVERDRNRAVLVRVPDRLDRNEMRRLERMRRGDRVRLDVRASSAADREAELVRIH